ncbi:MAG: T9SS type A sorting domain-containing protein [Rubricoccaceae bacterium]|nr:T9SS type A sorting domain-containing protein [Rubricoccaceae bacterium]
MHGRFLVPLLLAVPLPALGQWTSALHDTGVVQLEVFDNGKLGAFSDGAGGTIGEGFVFAAENGLFEGAFVVGQDYDQVSGDVYGYPDLEWITVEPITAITPPAGFDEAYEAVYTDSGAPNPIGLDVTQTTYGAAGDPFLFVEFSIANTSGGDLEDLYVGVFTDWNIGNSNENDWWYGSFSQILYAFDLTRKNPNHYGVAALDPPDNDYPVSGFSGCADGAGEASLYAGLTVIQLCGPGGPKDVRAILGVGPINIAVGEAVSVSFAFVGGTDQGDVLENAQRAQCVFVSECPPTSSEPTAPASSLALHAPTPNPARGATTFSFSLDRPMPVHLSILDTLGREVAVLVDGATAAGEHRVRWEATGLPAGVYLVRLSADGAALSRRVALSR